jgi:3-oxoacyl-[acyl-carrier-protein] synthase-1
VVSAIGCGKADTLKALREKRTGIGPVKYLETSLRDFPVGEVPLSNAELAARTGAPETWPRTTLLSVLALQEALEQASIQSDGKFSPATYKNVESVEGTGLPEASAFLLAKRRPIPSNIPLVSGTTVGGMDLSEKLYPMYSPWHSCGASTDLAAQFLGFKEATTLSTACSSAANAFIYAANLIRCGFADKVVAGGAESLSDYHLNGFNSLMILDPEWCRPFDATRAGLNLGEGAAFLVLETEESALERGAKPLAVLSGWGNACDAFHQTASSQNGEGAFQAMSQALKRAGLKPEDIGYVNAHGTGTPNNDASESTALRRIFGDRIPPVSSTKPYTGHTTSASGSIEAVFCLLALQNGLFPPELNWREADPGCIIPYSGGDVPGPRHILSNAFGFGGNDSSIILSRI